MDPNATARGDDSTGLTCELKSYDVRYNSKGKRVTLAAGTTQDLGLYKRGNGSALRLTTWYSMDSDIERTELLVKSPHLVTALKEVIQKYPGVSIDGREIVIPDLPKCLFHYRNELISYMSRQGDQRAMDHLRLLIDYTKKVFESQLMSYSSLMESPNTAPSLSFENLWMAFKPGSYIYRRWQGAGNVFRLKRMMKQKTSREIEDWCLEGEEIEYDGREFGYVISEHRIHPYDGIRALEQLRIFPLEYSSNMEDIRSKMIERGKKYVSLRGIHHKKYDSSAEALAPSRDVSTLIGEVDNFPLRSSPISGRIMVDCDTFGVIYPSKKVCFDWDMPTFNVEAGDHEKFSDDDFLICAWQMPGFSLNKKCWCYFDVSHIEDVELNHKAFDRLLLPEDQKRMIHSLVQAHTHETSNFEDVIEGKGKGMIFLLHGEPGSGKTLTAESVADYTGRPLYTISCGELGVEAASLEENLSRTLHLATLWRAVVLLDEADVFLERRSKNDLQRNGLVSIFLRLLEYYEGILFLTTNRIEAFDAAFKSRIHLAIKYPPLQYSTRRELWRMFINMISTEVPYRWLDDKCLERFAAEVINGRQIKNTVRTAHALAISNGVPLDVSHIEISLRASRNFEADFAEGVEQVESIAEGQVGLNRKRKRV